MAPDLNVLASEVIARLIDEADLMVGGELVAPEGGCCVEDCTRQATQHLTVTVRLPDDRDTSTTMRMCEPCYTALVGDLSQPPSWWGTPGADPVGDILDAADAAKRRGP